MTHDSLVLRGWHTATLHVVGERTLYRGTNSVTADQIASSVTRLEDRLQARPDGVSPSGWLDLQSFWDESAKLGTKASTSRKFLSKPDGIAEFFEACDIARETYLTERWLGMLRDEGLVREVASGSWSLTPTGIAASVEARDWCERQNVTAFWVDRVIDQPYFQKLVTHLQYACARSAHFNELHDLVNGYLLNLINRNGLRARIAAGNQPSPSNIRSWCYKSALSQFRDEGRDALTRSFKGARTEKELRLGITEEANLPAETQGVFLGVDADGRDDVHVSGSGSSAALLDVVGGNLEDDIIHRLTAQRGIALTEAAIRREKAGAKERFLRIHQMTLDDMGFADIGAAEGVSRNRAAALVADLRAAVQRATVFSANAVQALEYLREEPCSTLDDIHAGLIEKARDAWEKQVEDAGGDTSAVSPFDPSFVEGIDTSVMDALVSAGRLRRVGDGGFMVTPSGEAALDNGERFGIELNLNAMG